MSETIEAPRRTARQVSERELAIALVMEFAETEQITVSLMGFYDDDADFISNLAQRVGVALDGAFNNKLRKVMRRLVQYGVFYSRMRGTQKEYFGEPEKTMVYWLKNGKDALIRREAKPGICMGPLGETEFLLRHAYPDPADA